MATPVEFVSVLHQAKTQAQVWHHQTPKYSEHKALGHLYENLTGFIDGFVESLQGYMPRLVGYTTKPLVDWKEGQAMEYLKMLCEYVEAERAGVGTASWIQNQVDELQKLLYQIKYELTLN
jgi:hypothetical protein